MSEVKTTQVEVWVMIGEDGQYSVHHDPDELRGRFDEECDGAGLTTRVVRVTLTVPLPQPIEMTGVVPLEPTDGQLKVA